MKLLKHSLILCTFVALFAAPALFAQDPQSQPDAAPPARGGGMQGGPRVFGTIAAINGNTITVNRSNGQAVTVKLTDQTQFRRERNPATIADFKVGDMVMIRGTENSDHTFTAQIVGGRAEGASGPGGGRMERGPAGNGPGRGPGANLGTLGKDYVAGEVTAITAPRLSILRPDGVAQNVELSENTTIRRGRDSITMADIQVGDHVMVRGGMQGDAFAPRSVNVMNAEQWKRMQENSSAPSPDTKGVTPPPPASPAPQSSTPPGLPN